MQVKQRRRVPRTQTGRRIAGIPVDSFAGFPGWPDSVPDHQDDLVPRLRRNGIARRQYFCGEPNRETHPPPLWR